MAVKGGPAGGVYQVPGFSKGLRLIELLCAARQPLGVSELSQQLGLNKPMVFRLLRTLLAAGWVVQDGEGPKYRMSWTTRNTRRAACATRCRFSITRSRWWRC